MKLSKEQIAQIDETLVLNKVIYDDIKLELTDHIASDIEEIITNQEVSFEAAFKETLEKWHLQLKPSKNSLWLGDSISGPKMFVEEWVARSKRQTIYSYSISIGITIIILGIMKIYNYPIISEKIEKIYPGIAVGIASLLIVGRIFLFKFSRSTTFGYLFRKRFFHSIWTLLFLALMVSFNNFFTNAPKNFTLIQLAPIIFLMLFGLLKAAISLKLLYKHFQFEKKLSKV